MARIPRIGILEVGRPPETLAAEHGDYPAFVRRWLQGVDAEFRTWAVLDGELPAAPEEADLWIITGSRFGTYEDHPWIAPLEAFIRACRDRGVRMFGICFGHQIIAQALGGVVRRAEVGWGLGVTPYRVESWPLAGPHPEQVKIQAYHRDQVVEAPPGAVRTLTAGYCPIAGLWYPGFAFTVQGHPEFPATYAEELIEARRGTVLSEAEAARGLGTVRDPADADVVAALLARFLTTPEAFDRPTAATAAEPAAS